MDANAVSGAYVARLSSLANPEDVSHVPFVVREAIGSPRADLLYQLGDSTWQAYNNYNDVGPAQSFYQEAGEFGPPVMRAVSYNRPWRNRISGIHGPKHFLFDLDVPLIRFLEANGFSVGYAGSADLEAWAPEFPLDSSNPLFGRKAYVANGHEEYWPGRRRQNLEMAVASGTHMLFLAGNTAYFKTRFQNDTADTPRRIQVCYKDQRPDGPANPLKNYSEDDPAKNGPEWTGVYRDTRPNAWDPSVPAWDVPRSVPAGSINSLTGSTPAVVNLVEEGNNPGNVPPMTVPPSMKGLRVWRNTNCALAVAGCTLGIANVGFEIDLRADRYSEPFVGSQPAGLFSVSATVLDLTADGLHADKSRGYMVLPFTDVVDLPLPRTTIEATMYRSSSGALVFASSSFRWSHGLDNARSTGVAGPGAVSLDMQQATINILADMGVEPAPEHMMLGGLVRASISTDHSAPVSTITQLNHASGVVSGEALEEVNGGVVAGVEISFDAGQTWHGTALGQSVLTPEGRRTSWSHTSVVTANLNPLVRAVDDSGNLEAGHGPASTIPESDGLAVTTIGVVRPPSGGPNFAQQIAPAPGGVRWLTPGWTSLIPMDMNGDQLTDLLSYNASTGEALYEVAVAGSPGMRTPVSPVIAAAPGWTSIVPMNIHGATGLGVADLLSYNAATGLAYYSVGVSPGVQEIVNMGTSLPVEAGIHAAPGWTSIVPMNINGDALTDLLWYNSATGLEVFTTGVWHGTAYYTQEVVAVRDGALGWTSIVPMRMNGDTLTDLLSYNAGTGLSVYSIGNGLSQTVVRTVTAAAGWTSIVPFDLNGDGLTDLLSYNAASGLAYYSVAGGGVGYQWVVGGPVQGAAWWTSIVPMKLLAADPPGTTRALLYYR